jgi:hypothetical protein
VTTAHAHFSLRQLHPGEVTVITEHTFRGRDLTSDAVDEHFAQPLRTAAMTFADHATQALTNQEAQREEQMSAALEAALDAVDPRHRRVVAERFGVGPSARDSAPPPHPLLRTGGEGARKCDDRSTSSGGD